MKVSKKSIWDQFYKFGGEDQWRPREANICAYIRGIIWGGLKALWYVFAGVIAAAFLIYPWFVLVMWAITGTFLPTLVGGGENTDVIFSMSFGIQALFVMLFVGFLAKEKYEEYDRHRTEEMIEKHGYNYEVEYDKPWLITIWYRAFKEKTCFIIERE